MQAFEIIITPRLYETDAMGHINNATIAAWMEIVRIRFLESLSSDRPGLNRNWTLASVHIDFVSETFYGTDVIASVIDVVVGNTSLTFHCEMHQEGRLTVRGTAVLVQWDAQSKKTTRIGDDLRKKIAGV